MTALQEAEAALSPYTAELPGQIREQVQQAWTPTLKGAVGATEEQMKGFLPKYWGMPEQLGGRTAADLSPGQKMSLMGGELGSMVGQLQSSQQVADYLGGQMEDMYGRAQEAARLGYTTAADAYARQFDLYQQQWQARETEKQREWQAQQAEMERAASARAAAKQQMDWQTFFDEEGLDTIPTAQPDAQTNAALSELANIPDTGITKEERRDSAEYIMTRYPGIDPRDAYDAAGFTDYWNPALVPEKWEKAWRSQLPIRASWT